MEVVIDIDTEGNMHCLYTDQIDLFAVGRVTNMRKASNVEFNEEEQVWEVTSLNGQVLYTNANRNMAIEWEIANFSVGGPLYHN